MKKQINSAFKAYILLAFAIAFLQIVNAANATCPDGAERPCVINGKHGHQVCGHGGAGACAPDEEPTPHPTAASPTPSPTPAYDLTGTYTADDGGVYYVRQAGKVLWWAGMSTESELGVLDFHKGLRFTNVFRGTISGNTIDGEWADVPRGRFLQSGRLLLRFSYLGSTSASFVKTSQTGGFGASRWTKRIVVNSNPAACENASSANIVCKFDRVTKSNGGTLLHGGDLVPYKDNVVIFGQVTNRAKLEQEDGDFDFDMAVERVNWSATGLDQLLGGFWTEGWLPDSWTNGSPSAIRAKLDRHNNNAHVEAIR